MRIVQFSLFTIISLASLELHAAGTQAMSLDEAEQILRTNRPSSGYLTSRMIVQAWETLGITEDDMSRKHILQSLGVAKRAVQALDSAKIQDAEALKRATLKRNILQDLVNTALGFLS